MRNLFLLISLIAWMSVVAAKADSLNGVVLTEVELAYTIDQLRDPQRELQAVEKLVKFSGVFLHPASIGLMTSNREIDDRCKRAALALDTKTEFSAKIKALDHEDRAVRFWAVRSALSVVLPVPALWEKHAETFERIAASDADPEIRNYVAMVIRNRKQ